MGDQAGRKHPPKKQERRLVFDKRRGWVLVTFELAMWGLVLYTLFLVFR